MKGWISSYEFIFIEYLWCGRFGSKWTNRKIPPDQACTLVKWVEEMNDQSNKQVNE